MSGAGEVKRAALLIVLALFFGTVARADTTYEACFRSRTNSARTAHGVPALKIDARIDKVARDHSDEMSRAGTIYHNESLGDDLPPYEYAGENVGEGPDCDAIFDAFKGSPGHYANILDRDYQYLGVGVTLDAEGTLYVTLDFWTPRAVTAPPKRPPPRTPQPGPRCTCHV